MNYGQVHCCPAATSPACVQTMDKDGSKFGGPPVSTSSSPSSKNKGPDLANKAATSVDPKLRDLMPLDLALDED